MFFQNLRYIFLVCLIAFGLIAIVGSNGGDGTYDYDSGILNWSDV